MNPIHQPQKTTRRKLLLCVILAGGILVGIFSFKRGQNNSPEGFSVWKDIFAWYVNDSFYLLRRRRVALRQAVTSAIFTPKAKLNILPPAWIWQKECLRFSLVIVGLHLCHTYQTSFIFKVWLGFFFAVKKKMVTTNTIFFDKQPCEETEYSVDWWFNFPFSDTVFPLPCRQRIWPISFSANRLAELVSEHLWQKFNGQFRKTSHPLCMVTKPRRYHPTGERCKDTSSERSNQANYSWIHCCRREQPACLWSALHLLCFYTFVSI